MYCSADAPGLGRVPGSAQAFVCDRPHLQSRFCLQVWQQLLQQQRCCVFSQAAEYGQLNHCRPEMTICWFYRLMCSEALDCYIAFNITGCYIVLYTHACIDAPKQNWHCLDSALTSGCRYPDHKMFQCIRPASMRNPVGPTVPGCKPCWPNPLLD